MADPDLAQTLRRARKYHRPSVEALLGVYYPPTYRMAHALTGRKDVAGGVMKFVMQRSLAVLPKWEHPDVAQRWFAHHTVLTVRRAEKYPPDAYNDVLIKDQTPAPDPAYIAFVRAVRSLPYQQREAFLLHHGEAMDIRAMAVAMDCSTEAATNHLHAAARTLQSIVGPSYDVMLPRLKAAYATLIPTEAMAMPAIRSAARRYFLPRLARRIAIALLLLVILSAVAWIFRDRLREMIAR